MVTSESPVIRPELGDSTAFLAQLVDAFRKVPAPVI
jgi:hypothetical protein